MTPDARARMRSTIQTSLRQARLPGGSLDHPGVLPARVDVSTPDDLLDRFRSELTALGGNVHETRGLDEIVAVLLPIVASQNTPRVLAWDDQCLPVRGLRDRLVAAGVVMCPQQTSGVGSDDRRGELASATVGLTGADAGLADTGSIVVTSGQGRGRLASLLPPVHVALLPRSALVESLSALFASRPELVIAGSNFTCITGPSRTADIELTLSRGVHGPKEVHVLVVE